MLFEDQINRPTWRNDRESGCGGSPLAFFEIKFFLDKILISEFLQKLFWVFPDFLGTIAEISATPEISTPQFFGSRLTHF